MSDSGAVEGGLQSLWNNFLSIFNKGKDEVVRSSKVSKTRLDLSSLKKDRGRVFERLGEEVYKRHKDKAQSLSGFDSLFTEIDIINIKLSAKERELKGLSTEDAGVVESRPADSAGAGIRPERRERPYRPRPRGPHLPKEAKQEATSSEIKTERPESDRRPKKRYYRPKKRPTDTKQEDQK